MADKDLDLLKDFPAVSTQEWLDKITIDLKGADFNKKLVWRTNEGFNVMPFYRSENTEGLKSTEVNPGAFPYVRGTKADNNWFVRQNISVENPEEANKKALEILNKGVNSLGFGLKKEDLSSDYIVKLLNGIDAEAVELNFSICVTKCAELARILVAYFEEKKYDAHNLIGSINCDPINRMLLKGKNLTKETITNYIKETSLSLATLFLYKAVGVNALTLSNAGAYISQELGYALAWGNEYLSTMIDAGVPPALAAKKIKFNFGVSSNYFMEIAKFRAARTLWALIVDAYQPPCPRTDCEHTVDGICKCAAKMKIHAETSLFNMTIFDANVNMLRSQTEAMSATLGGVDSLTIQPYDITYKKPDEFSERIARNQQLMLRDESHFNKISDPASGSYYVENLTKEIAEQAWKIFLEVEEKGGFYNEIKEGNVQKVIKETATARLKAISNRKEVLLGTNQFPNFAETASKKIQNTEVYCAACSSEKTGSTETLLPVRGAEEFEELRLATEKAAKRPKAFMLTIGSLAMRLARAQFSCNFFACAGYEVVDNLGFKTVEEGVDAAMKANANIVVLCSSDEEYDEYAPKAFELLKDKAILVVAGAPASMDDLKAKGIEYFINVKSNVLETLKGFNDKLL